MLNTLIAAALKNRLWVFTLFLGLMFLGLGAALHLPMDAVPDITHVQVVINTKTGALDPGKIEKLVTFPIETEMAGLPGVEDIRSLSKYGLSQVTVVFSDETSNYFARQMVSERLQNVRNTLPDHLTPEMAPMTTGLGEVLMYVVEPRSESPLAAQTEEERLTYLREVQEYVIRPHLRKLPGVADVDTNGGFLKQIHINVFPDRLKQFGISIEDFMTKIDSVGESFGGGYIQRQGSQIIVRATGRLTGLSTLESIPISMNVQGKPIRIRDVADVSVDHALRLGSATYDGHETVLGTVLMRVGANSREVSSLAEAAFRSGITLPENVTVKVLYSRSYLVNATLHTILKNLTEGAALVVIVLLLLLGNLRAALIVALAIPISMLIALKGMNLLGISANLMSLGAIDFGLLVDGAVVLIENIVTRLETFRGRRLGKTDRFNIVLESSQEVVRPVVIGILIIMLVYVPILFLEGIEGKMFRPMASTVLLALGGSLLVTLLLMPSLALIFLSPWTFRQSELPAPSESPKTQEPWVLRTVHQAYEPLLRICLRHKRAVLMIGAAQAVLAAILFMRLGSDFIPQLDEGDLVINLTRETNQDIDTSTLWQKKAEEIIKKFPEVESVFSRLGTPETALDPMGPYLADTFVILKKDRSAWPIAPGSPADQAGKRRTKDDLYEAIRVELEKNNPDQEIAATQPIEMRFNEILEGSRADVSLRIFGPDLDKLLDYSIKAKDLLEGTPGISSLEFDPLTALTRSPVLDVVLNYEKLARYGIPLKDVNGILESTMSGREVGSYYEEDRRFPIVLHLDESLRNRIEEIEKVPVGLPEGGTIPLALLTDIKQKSQVTTVARSGTKRYSALSIFLKDRDLGSFVAEAKELIQQKLGLEKGYEVVWGGQFQNLEKARNRLIIIVPVTLSLIFLFLLMNFGTLRHALLVFTAIPFAMAGGVYSLYFRGINFSVSAAVGFIALAGIAILNSMVLVTYFNQLRKGGASIQEASYQGALRRLRPVLMTALVASFGFLPMALNTSTGAEVQRPLATVVIGGLITSTLLTLIVVPVLYQWIESRFADKAN